MTPFIAAMEDSPSGLWRTLGKRVGFTPSRVRISYPPPAGIFGFPKIPFCYLVPRTHGGWQWQAGKGWRRILVPQDGNPRNPMHTHFGMITAPPPSLIRPIRLHPFQSSRSPLSDFFD